MKARDLGVLSADELVWGVAALAALFRIPFDAKLLLQQFPPPYSLETLILAAQALGLEGTQSTWHSLERERLRPPFLVLLPPSEEFAAPEPGTPDADPTPTPGLRLALLARVEEGNAHYFLRDDPEPHIEPLSALQARALGPVVSFRKQPEPVTDPAADRAPQPFGFRWFVPELLKHRSLWRDVLLASLAIQILALATPIFTQVIIDKVVVPPVPI